MTDADKVVLDFMRVRFDRLEGRIGETTKSIQELIHRVGSLEQVTALLHRDFAHLSTRMDQIDLRLERIERRRDIYESERP